MGGEFNSAGIDRIVAMFSSITALGWLKYMELL